MTAGPTVTILRFVSTAELLYDALGRWDLPAVRVLLAEDIRWSEPVYDGRAFGGAYHGRGVVATGVLGALDDAYEGVELVLEELLERDGRAIARGLLRGRSRKAGTLIAVPFVHHLRVRDGLVTDVECLIDTAAEREALGAAG